MTRAMYEELQRRGTFSTAQSFDQALEENRAAEAAYRARLGGRPGSGSEAVRMAIQEHRKGF